MQANHGSERVGAGWWLRQAVARPVVRQASLYALVVGPLLVVINHGPHWIAGHFYVAHLGSIILTLLVPYLVSTFSSVGALRRLSEATRQPGIEDDG